MHNQISLALDMIEQASWGYAFRLDVTNHSDSTVFVPTLEITDLRFVPVEITKPREWGTHLMVSGESGGCAIDPGCTKSFQFRVRPCSVDADAAPIEKDWEYGRWCLNLTQGEYRVWYDLTVDETYFNPDSHLRFDNIQKMANESGAILWCGSAKSNVLSVYHAEQNVGPKSPTVRFDF
jgi:hypothetical protein